MRRTQTTEQEEESRHTPGPSGLMIWDVPLLLILLACGIALIIEAIVRGMGG